MSSYFHHIVPNGPQHSGELAKAFGGNDEGLTDLCWSALNLVDSAAMFFRGSFPIQSVHFCWGETINLPWNAEYWDASADGQTFTPRPIGTEVENLAKHVLRRWDIEAEGSPPVPTWSSSFECNELAGSHKILMQALAVKVMLSVDGYLEHVKRGDSTTAMRWLVSAFRNIIECTCQAQVILGNPSDNGRAAAMVRHRENHEMKQQVFAWLDKNRSAYPSMDAAAEAISRGVVPVKFRTARDWVGQWARRPPSARTP